MEDPMRSFIVAAAIGAPFAAWAQDDRQTVEVKTDRDLYRNTFTIGAGALGAVDQGFDPRSPTGISWNLRYGWNPVNRVAWELGYTGATNEMTAQDTAANTVATILETDLKLDLLPRSPFTPILAAGVGYAAFTAGERQDLATMTVPLAGGLELRADNLLLGSRITYRPTFFDDLALSDQGGDSWMWTADIGTRF
jgi:hypothetical protein